MYAHASLAGIDPQPLALPESLEPKARDLVDRLLGLSMRTLSIRAGLGVRRTIESLAALAQTAPGRSDALAEISVGYVAQGAGIGVHSARAGLGMVLDVIGRGTLDPSKARAAGFPIRDVLAPRYRGPLRLLRVEALAALRTAREWLRANDLAVGEEVRPWRALSERDLSSRGYVALSGEASRGWALCPIHGETAPSLRLFDLGGSRGSRGAGFCHGCGRRVSWTRSETGATFVREARGERTSTEVSDDRGSIIPSKMERARPTSGFLSGRPRAVVGLPSGVSISGAAFEAVAGCSEGYLYADRDAEGMRRRWSADLLRALCWSDRSGPVAETGAWVASSRASSLGLDSRAFLPDRYLSVSPMRATRFALRPLRKSPTGSLAVPTRFEPGRQEWILVDLDDLDPALGWDPAPFCESVARRASEDPRLSGRCAVVRTSHGGLQVWLGLRSPETSSRLWWSREGVQRWYAEIAESILADARRSGRSGGFVDYSAAAPGRYGRRPGWRLLGGFEPFRVRVEGVVAVPGGAVLTASEARRLWRRSPTNTPSPNRL